MGAYEYTALDTEGREHRGVQDGDSARQVRQLLREQSLLPVTVTEISDVEPARVLRFSFGTRIGASELALLTRQLSTLVRSGIPLEEALLAVSQQSEKARVKSVVAGVRSRVLEGRTLAEGLGTFPRVFPEIYRATVSAGEQSGHLDAVLERMADYTENRQILQQKIRNAMVYPVLLTVICLAIVGVLLGYVVPEVVRVFEAGERELPLLTRILIGASDFLRAWWWLLAVITAVVHDVVEHRADGRQADPTGCDDDIPADAFIQCPPAPKGSAHPQHITHPHAADGRGDVAGNADGMPDAVRVFHV